MRNLKRALSLALACVMLLGMMITGAGAASSSSFTDYDQIVNQEAVEVTSGLGIFDGYTDGSFGPGNVVTRAEMAVIICKILNGSSVDPSNFSGISHFTDVPSWAEGYVNFCASMGIVVGVGEGKFNPNGTVTTVEATTMLLKALGYFQDDEDQLGLDWKTTVTGRATYLNLYGDLSLGANEGLTRDNVAELVFQTIQAQRVAYDDNRHLYVNNRNRNEVVTNGTKDWENTFGENTFDMWIVDGVVTANSYTLDSLSETVNNAPRTTVEFYDARTIAGYVNDYPAQTYQGNPVNNGYPFEYTTGLDMIGHAARVYYKIERNAPVVFAITDRATKVEYISYNSNSTLRANAANEAGFRRNTINDIPTTDYKVNYDWVNTVGVLQEDNDATNDVNLSGPDVNKTLLLISNSSDYKVDVVIVLDQYLDTVRRVIEATDTTAKEYKLTTSDGTDQNVPHDEFAVGDYVVVTDIGNQGAMLNIAAPEKVTASISRITGVSDSSGTVKSITADGTDYVGSPVAHHESAKQTLANARSLDNTTNFENIQTIGEATLLLDFQGKCIGLAEPESMTNYAYAAQFGVGHKNGSLNTEYGLTVKLYFIDGTNGVYNVNTSSGNSTTNTFKDLKMYVHGGEQEALAIAKLLNNGKGSAATGDYPYVVTNNNTNNATYDVRDTYTDALGVDASGKLTGITDETTTGLGIYKVSLRSDNSVVLTKLSVDVSENTDLIYRQDNAGQQSGKGVRLVPGHSTLVKQNGNNALQIGYNPLGSGDRAMYQTEKTAYFYVDGDYTATTFDGANVSVGVKYGVANAVSITVGGDKDTNGHHESIEQLFVSRVTNPQASDRDTVSAMMIYGYDMGANDTLYFYKEGNYHIYGQSSASRANGELVYVVYDMYDSNGELKQATYNNGGKYYDIEVARGMVEDNPTGYYTLGTDDIEPKFVVTKNGLGGAVNNGVVSDGSDATNREYNVIKTDAAKYGGTANGLDKAKNVYILNATVAHDEFTKNMYTLVDSVGGIVGLLDDNVTVVDTTGNNIDSTRGIADKCIAGETVRVSYTYKTDGDNAYKVKVLFVTDWKPKNQDTVVNRPTDNTITNGNASLTAPSYAAPVSIVPGVANTIYSFKRPDGAAATGTITWDETIYIKDNNGNDVLLNPATAKTDSSNAAVITDSAAVSLYSWMLASNSPRIVVTDVQAAAYQVKGLGGVVPTTDTLTTNSTGAQLTFKVPLPEGMTETTINFTIDKVYKAGDTSATQFSETATVDSDDIAAGYATITTANNYYAVGGNSGAVTISAQVGDATKQSVSVVFTGDAAGVDGWALTGTSIPTELSTSVAAVLIGDTSGVTITVPSNVSKFTGTISVSGLNETITPIAVTETNKTGGTAKTDAPFDGTSTYTATGPVVITVDIKVTEANYTASVFAPTLDASVNVDFAGVDLDGTAQAVTGTAGTVKGELKIEGGSIDDDVLPGTYTLSVLSGGTLTGGTKTAEAERAAGATFGTIEVTGVEEGTPILFQVTYTPDSAHALSIATGQDTSAVITNTSGGNTTSKYHVSGITASTKSVNDGDDVAKDEEVVVTVTITNDAGSGTTPDETTGTLNVKLGTETKTLDLSTVADLSSGTGTRDFTFTMPDSAAAISLSYTPA